jgi:membrane protease YdiL (CAAX protease family)
LIPAVCVLFLAAVQAAVAGSLGNNSSADAETLLFQAVVPGLDEELIFRGVLLALLDQAFLARWRLAGAELGWGTVAVSLLFGAVHGVGFDSRWHLDLHLLSVAFTTMASLVYCWLRARTGSLLFPVLTHNASNFILFAVR